MPNGESPETRYHAEVKVTVDGHEARINCFRDALDEVFLDIARIIGQFPDYWKSPARRELINAERKASQLRPEDQTGEIPVCQECGTDEFVELIDFADRKTGASRQAWKCQQCQKWHWPEKNKKGRGK